MGKMDAVMEMIARKQAMESPRELSKAEFKLKHPKGDAIGVHGFVAKTFEDTSNPDLVVKEPIGPEKTDDVASEGATISRIRKRIIDISEAGIAPPREEGRSINIKTEVCDSKLAKGLVDFLRYKIGEAHIAGVALVDIKTDSILVDSDGEMEMVDYNGSVLLPEWKMLNVVWSWRSEINEHVEARQKEQFAREAKQKKLDDLGFRSSELTVLKRKLERLAEAESREVLEYPVVNTAVDSSLMRKMLGSKTQVEILEMTADESLVSDKRGWEIIRKRAEELGLLGETQEVEKTDIPEGLVMGLFYVLGVSDLLNTKNEMAIRRINEGRIYQETLIRKHYGDILMAVKRYGETGSETDEKRIVAEVDNFLEKLLKSHFGEVISDWEKYASIYNNRSLDGIRDEEYAQFLSEQIKRARQAWEEGDYNEVANIDVEILIG